jgi:hypothetical protein
LQGCIKNITDMENSLKKKKIKFSHIQFKEIETGAVAKSYMKKCFQLYEEMCKYLVIFEEAVSHI